MALLSGGHRPMHMIDAEIIASNEEVSKLKQFKAALERHMNQLRIEEIRLREIMHDEEQAEYDNMECEEGENHTSGSSGYDSDPHDDSPK